MILLAVVVGLIFGAIWLTLYRPPFIRQTQLWVVATVSAILTWTAIAFVQGPLQSWYSQALNHFWDQTTIGQWMLLAGHPVSACKRPCPGSIQTGYRPHLLVA